MDLVEPQSWIGIDVKGRSKVSQLRRGSNHDWEGHRSSSDLEPAMWMVSGLIGLIGLLDQIELVSGEFEQIGLFGEGGLAGDLVALDHSRICVPSLHVVRLQLFVFVLERLHRLERRERQIRSWSRVICLGPSSAMSRRRVGVRAVNVSLI